MQVLCLLHATRCKLLEAGVGKSSVSIRKTMRSIAVGGQLASKGRLQKRMTDIAQYEEIWNGTEPGWVVVRHTEDRYRLVVSFESGAETADLKALRQLLPELAATPISQLMALKGSRSFDLGEHESADAHRLKARCASLGLVVQATGWQFVSCGIFNENTRAYCLIEDEGIRQQVVDAAIQHGLPIRESNV